MIFFVIYYNFLKLFYGVILPVLKSSGGDIDRFIGWGLCSPPSIAERDDIDVL